MPRRPARSVGSRATSRPTIATMPSALSAAKSESRVSAQSAPPNIDDEIDKIPIASLTLDVPLIPFNPPKRRPINPFHFLRLPSELRIKIYEYYFEDIDDVLDLGPDNYKRIHKRLSLMRVCRLLHDEGTYYFYSTRTFRLFPTHPGKYFKSKKPLLARLKPIQRQAITSLQLRLGPGWNAPPRGWVVNDALGLKDCHNVRTLNIFVEFDPSDGVFKGFRRSEGFYESFSRKLLTAVIEDLPMVDTLEFDAWSSVKKTGAMMHTLFDVAAKTKLLIRWGPERGWTDDMDEDEAVEVVNNFAPISDYVPSELLVSA